MLVLRNHHNHENNNNDNNADNKSLTYYLKGTCNNLEKNKKEIFKNPNTGEKKRKILNKKKKKKKETSSVFYHYL